MNDQGSRYSHSQLFSIRLWWEDMGSADREIRGEVCHVLGGGGRYFQEWATLVTYLAEKMHDLEAKPKGGDGIADSVDM